MPVDGFGHGPGKAVQQVALDGFDEGGQVFGNATGGEGRVHDQVVRLHQPLGKVRTPVQVDQRAAGGLGVGQHGHPCNGLAVPPHGQGVTGLVDGG
ncbi:hypothetical protein D3C77_667860 [compost metagenome]